MDASYEDLAAHDWLDEKLPERISEARLGEHWNVSTRTLQRWRAEGEGPRWMRLGKKVVYRRSDVRQFEVEQINR